jgi:hypothetical protein
MPYDVNCVGRFKTKQKNNNKKNNIGSWLWNLQIGEKKRIPLIKTEQQENQKHAEIKISLKVILLWNVYLSDM